MRRPSQSENVSICFKETRARGRPSTPVPSVPAVAATLAPKRATGRFP